MSIKHIIIGLVILIPSVLNAQDIQITQFERNNTSLIASMYPEYDNTGEPGAVIRFLVPDEGFVIECNLGILKQDTLLGEIRIWVPKGTKRITIRHKDYRLLDKFEIPVRIESKVTYDASIDVVASLNDNTPQRSFLGILNHLFAKVSIGTEGLSLGLSTPISSYVDLDLGVNFMPGFKIKDEVDIATETVRIENNELGTDEYHFEKLQVVGNLSRTTFDAKLSIYPGGYRFPLFIAGGLSFGGEKIGTTEGYSSAVARLYAEHPEYSGWIDAKFSDVRVAIDKSGYINGEVKVQKIRPYLGLGYGRLSTSKRRFDFRIEAGCQFIGKMQIYQNGEKIDKDLKDIMNGLLPQIIDKINIYPVIKLSLIYRFI